MSKIKDIISRTVLDSRGNPTVEVEVHTQSGTVGRASVPSGASVGKNEAIELRDGDSARYMGQGVQKAVHNVKEILQNALIGTSVYEQTHIDALMVALDDTRNKSKLGANAILGVSLAVAKAAALEAHMPLYRYLGGVYARTLPVPMINVLNGGMHASNALDIQECMIVPLKASDFSTAIRMSVEVFYHLRQILVSKGFSTNVGDEGGFAPDVSSNEEAFELVIQAIERAGYKPGEDMALALDVAASTFYDHANRSYQLRHHKGARTLSAYEMIDVWKTWTETYPIFSLEDPMAEDDWEGWKKITTALGDKIQLVGDDLFVTHTDLIQKGVDTHVANAVLIKMNQVGTLSETMSAVQMTHQHGYKSIISHRSGETEDTTIADLAVALNARYIKAGSVSRVDRTAKYNQLLRIEEMLGKTACFAGNL